MKLHCLKSEWILFLILIFLISVYSHADVNGVWGDWGAWSQLSPTCGGSFAVATRRRFCNHGINNTDNISNINNTNSTDNAITSNNTNINNSSNINSNETIVIQDNVAGNSSQIVVTFCNGSNTDIFTTTVPPCFRENLAPKNGMRPENATWGDWGAWSRLSPTCGGGAAAATRTRPCNRVGGDSGPVIDAGNSSPPPHQPNVTACDGSNADLFTVTITPPCPPTGVWTGWTEWSRPGSTCVDPAASPSSSSPPSSSSSQLVVYRERNCTATAAAAAAAVVVNATECEGGIDAQARKISLPLCTTDGGWSLWSPWQPPSVTCSKFNVSVIRSRTCNSPEPANGGKPCPGSKIDTGIIFLPQCKINGSWSAWGPFSALTITCGVTQAAKTRARSCTNPPPSGGAAGCEGSATETFYVDVPDCNELGWENWQPWSVLSATCGKFPAIRSRARICRNTLTVNGGVDCVGGAVETKFEDVPTCVAERGCPAKFTLIKETNRCFYLVFSKMGWQDQRDFCNMVHPSAHLIAPADTNDLDAITDYLYSVNFVVSNRCTDKATSTPLIWTAAQKNGTDFAWKPYTDREDYSPLPDAQELWAQNNPDNIKGLEDCVHLVDSDEGYRLSDVACSHTSDPDYNRQFINFTTMCGLCEVDLPKPKWTVLV